jgi:hypothetical protein
MSRKQQKPADDRDTRSGVWDDIRQRQFPEAFRILMPNFAFDTHAPIMNQETGGMPPVDDLQAAGECQSSARLLAEVATCLWYLKTKFFRRDWASEDVTDDDPRTRRAIGRLNKCLDAIKANGIEIDDPTNTRYPSGGENMMRPIEFQPTAGLTYERVTETIAPIVYRNGQLIQRGEVFVAVPMEDVAPSPPPTVQQEVVPMPNTETDTTEDAPESAIDDGARNDSLNNQHLDTSN